MIVAARLCRPWILLPLLLAVACASLQPAPSGSAGSLLVIGGALSKDNDAVYGRLLQLARQDGRVRLLIATAASGDEEGAAASVRQAALRREPDAIIETVMRGASTAETVAAVQRARAVFFTGGDQKRITDRYRPGDSDTPEWLALRQLLARGGAIAGNSAGDAMMGEVMFYTGRSAQALGLPRMDRDPDDEDANRTGPQIGPGMQFLPWAVTDSHFWERDRIGRLVAALEVSGRRIGLGVGENACVEIDLATGACTGLTAATTLLVDAGALARDGACRRGCRGRVLHQGESALLPALLASGAAAPARPSGAVTKVAVGDDDSGSERVFMGAMAQSAGAARVVFDGWSVVAWRDGDGVAFDVEVGAAGEGGR